MIVRTIIIITTTATTVITKNITYQNHSNDLNKENRPFVNAS